MDYSIKNTFIYLLTVICLLSPALAISNETDIEKVKLRLLWKHQFQFAGYYMAIEKGFYADKKLDVEIIEFDSTIDNTLAVINEETEFAVGRSSLLIDKANDADIIALLAAFQQSPFMLLTRAFTGIQNPADLAGHRIMITSDAEKSGELIAMLIKAGLTSNDYIAQPHSFNIDDLIENNTDAMASYLSNEPYKLIQQGIPYNILHPADFGFEMYSDILFTSGKLLKRNPELIQRFYDASIQGWKYAFANITETVSIIHQKYNSQNRTKEALLFEGQELKKLAFDEQKNFGRLMPHRFRSMAQIYLLTGAIDKVPELNGFIYNPPAGKLNLTYDELEYIKDKQVLNVCVQKDWPPYEIFSGKQYQGIMAEYINLIRDKTGLSVYPVPTDSIQQAATLTLQGICDITSAVTSITTKENLFLYSNSYTNVPLVYVSAKPQKDASNLSGRVAISINSPYYNQIKNCHPPFTIVDATSGADALIMLKERQVDGVIGSQAHIRYLLIDNEIQGMNLIDYPLSNWKTSFMMNQQHPILRSILNKTIQLFTTGDRDRIMSHWVSSIPKQRLSSQTFWLLIGLVSVFSIFILYRYVVTLIRSRILLQLSETDQLTGISNRRKTIEQLQHNIDIANRYARVLSLIYFDIDNFKLINDNFGHETGDGILIELTGLIKKHIRKTDTFGRWGGEEFLIVSPESESDDAEKLTLLLKQQINEFNFKLPQQVSCSFGVTRYTAGESMNEFIKRADHAMYEAKRKGKNSIIVKNA